jgi:hypothetical protein
MLGSVCTLVLFSARLFSSVLLPLPICKSCFRRLRPIPPRSQTAGLWARGTIRCRDRDPWDQSALRKSFAEQIGVRRIGGFGQVVAARGVANAP